MTGTVPEQIKPETVLRLYGITQAAITPLEIGLINRTWQVVCQQGNYILQQVNPMFGPDIHQDIESITSWLSTRGMITPRLLHTLDQHLYCELDGRIWRVFDYIEGYTVNNVSTPHTAFEAGKLLASFHRALFDLDYSFHNQRSGVHDTNRHLQILRSTLQNQQHHPRYRIILPLATEILDTASRLAPLPELNLRKVHGDPKINNFLFDTNTNQGVCMLDFDTLGNMALPLELGDAMRSWCNPAGENSEQASFSTEYFTAGLQGYASVAADFISKTEWNSIIPATELIYIELAARFCADALNENYFSWDNRRFESHSEHSRIRALSQLNAYKSLVAQYGDTRRIQSQVTSDSGLE